MPKTPYERTKASRDRKLAAGMVRFEKLVWPSVRDELHKIADRLNSKAEKERK